MRARLAATLGLLALRVRAGYITVGMDSPHQCKNSTVQWYGDEGPYHLLLTPTQFVSHGYNVWIPTIPNGTNSYTLPIRQPEGMQFMVTVWGASGIEYAGTTDVLTVLPSNDTTCFLSDAAINTLYTFAFNISNSNDSFPPQCSNLTMSWPTSLKSEIPMERRSDGSDERLLDSAANEVTAVTVVGAPRRRRQSESVGTTDAVLIGDDSDKSSSKTQGNTTVPPTMFGIIPLGNSFSIPITYSSKAKGLVGLPESSLSDDPTTWTSKGVTHMNWTISLAKGTRFILVAGIGSQQEWASGGSSEMMTVGQGGSQCFQNNDSGPKVTATGSKGQIRPTSTPSADSSPPASNARSTVVVVLACIFSVAGTLLLIGFLWFCCRVRRKRKRATIEGRPKPSVLNIASFGRLDAKHGVRVRRDGSDTPLDLISPFEDFSDVPTPPGSGRHPPNPYNPYASPTSRPVASPSGSDSELLYRDPHERPYAHTIHGSIGGSRASTLYDEGPYPPRPVTMFDDSPLSPNSPGLAQSTLISPVRQHSGDRTGDIRHDLMGRQSSIDGLVSYPPMAHSQSMKAALARGAVFREREPAVESDDDDPNAHHLHELKRETLAMLDSQPNSPVTALSSAGMQGSSHTGSHIGSGTSSHVISPLAGSSRGPQRDDDDDGSTEYVVHRDAGRMPAPRRVLELPPRYDELVWNEEAGPALAEIAQSSPVSPATPAVPTVPVPAPVPTPPPRSPSAGPRSPASPARTASPATPSRRRTPLPTPPTQRSPM